MKRISRFGIDALRREYFVLTSHLMSATVAGEDCTCVLGALVAAADCAGYGEYYTEKTIENAIVSMLSNSRKMSEEDAREHFHTNGLTGAETMSMVTTIFSHFGYESGTSTPTSQGGCNFVAFDTGEMVNGKPNYHAGTLVNIENGIAYVIDGDGVTHEVPESKLMMQYNINKVPDSGGDDNCGSGDDGCGCGSGCGCGCGSGTWY